MAERQREADSARVSNLHIPQTPLRGPQRTRRRRQTRSRGSLTSSCNSFLVAPFSSPQQRSAARSQHRPSASQLNSRRAPLVGNMGSDQDVALTRVLIMTSALFPSLVPTGGFGSTTPAAPAFGAPASSTPSFGQPAAGGGLFGGGNTANTGAASTGFSFGSSGAALSRYSSHDAPTDSATLPPGGATSTFGQPAASTGATGGLFGAPKPATSTFGGFGQPAQQQQQPATGGGLFGAGMYQHVCTGPTGTLTLSCEQHPRIRPLVRPRPRRARRMALPWRSTRRRP